MCNSRPDQFQHEMGRSSWRREAWHRPTDRGPTDHLAVIFLTLSVALWRRAKNGREILTLVRFFLGRNKRPFLSIRKVGGGREGERASQMMVTPPLNGGAALKSNEIKMPPPSLCRALDLLLQGDKKPSRLSRQGGKRCSDILSALFIIMQASS